MRDWKAAHGILFTFHRQRWMIFGLRVNNHIYEKRRGFWPRPASRVGSVVVVVVDGGGGDGTSVEFHSSCS